MHERKCKLSMKRLKENIVSTKNEENWYQESQYDSDDQYSGFDFAESVDENDDHALDQYEYNNGINDARNLNALKKEMNCQQIGSLTQDRLEMNSYFWVIKLKRTGQVNKNILKGQKIWMRILEFANLLQVNIRNFLLLLLVQW